MNPKRIIYVPQRLCTIQLEDPEYQEWRTLSNSHTKQVKISEGGWRIGISAYTNNGLVDFNCRYHPEIALYDVWAIAFSKFMWDYEVTQVLTTAFKDNLLLTDPRGLEHSWLSSF